MSKKSIFNASFEESLNLEDDTASRGFIERNLEELREKEKYRGTLKSYIWLIILTILFVFGLNWAIYKMSGYFTGYLKEKMLQPVIFNFLPSWLFWLLVIIWLLLVLLGKRFYQQFILVYRGQFHIFVTYIFLLLIELNLFFLTCFVGMFGLLVTFSLLLVNVYLIYLIFRNRYKNLRYIMYSETRKTEQKMNVLISKIVNNFLVILGLLSLFWLGFKTFVNVEVDYSLKVLGIIATWFVSNILFIIFESYIIFPFMLRGFYRLKYPEEYRAWEGKSLEEWYGVKYLKKHKELTENR
ncbi:MAG: hypothetical protein Q4A90_01655 [Streptococcus sp.]|nr:hypothetical protein [Streptococcus sp.]